MELTLKLKKFFKWGHDMSHPIRKESPTYEFLECIYLSGSVIEDGVYWLREDPLFSGYPHRSQVLLFPKSTLFKVRNVRS